MVVADLHVHTTNSDGTLDLAAVPDVARRAGLAAVGITDHDRIHPDLDAPVVERDGVTVIHGIELRAEGPSERIDLLGYGVEATPALREEVERLQRDRVERGREMVAKVEDYLGVDLDVELREGIGRPHVARAIAERPDLDYDVSGAFEHLIGEGGPCFVPRDVPSFERGRDLLADACAVVGLAHPLRYDDPRGAIELADSLDAIELWYPYGGQVDVEPVERAIEEFDLLPTGGSDAHDDELGVSGMPRGAYQDLAARLPDPVAW